MILINFGHPLSTAVRAQIQALTGEAIERDIELKTQFNHQVDFAQQARELVDQAGLSAEEWQTAKVLINPPTFNLIAVTVLAELHGRMGYFSPALRLRPVEGALPPVFELAEIVNLQRVRDSARKQR